MPGRRLFYILNGSGVCINGASYAFSKDTVCLWNAGLVYFWDCNGEIDFICANFDYIQAYGYKPGFLSIILPDQFDTAPVFGNEAPGLLDSTGLSIGEISRRVGFKNASHFSTVFTKKGWDSPIPV